MLLILLYDTGARVQELADLNISSLHLEKNTPFVTLIGKGKKSRNVPLLQKLGHESMSITSGFYAFATLEMMSNAIKIELS